jgi:hypothetical protein
MTEKVAGDEEAPLCRYVVDGVRLLARREVGPAPAHQPPHSIEAFRAARCMRTARAVTSVSNDSARNPQGRTQ